MDKSSMNRVIKKDFIFFLKNVTSKSGVFNQHQQNKYQVYLAKNVISKFEILKAGGHCEAMLDVTKNTFY